MMQQGYVALVVLGLCVGILAVVILIVFRQLGTIRDDMQWFERRLANLEKTRYRKRPE